MKKKNLKMVILLLCFSLLTPIMHTSKTYATPSALSWTELSYTSGYTGNPPPFTNALFAGGAYGVAVDSVGTVYAVNSGQNEVKKLVVGQTEWITISTQGEFNLPSGVAVDSSGNVYVTDTYNSKVKMLKSGDTTWKNITYTGMKSGYPYGIAVDGSGNVYVTQANTVSPYFSILKLEKNTTSWTDLTKDDFLFYKSYGIAVDSAGNLYVADTNGKKIRMLANNASAWTDITYSGGFLGPYGIAVDGSGNLYVADVDTVVGTQSSIKELVQGTTSWVDISSTGNYTFEKPQGIAVTGNGYLYATDKFIKNTSGSVQTTNPNPTTPISTPIPSPTATPVTSPTATPTATPAPTGPVIPISLDAIKYTLGVGGKHSTVVHLDTNDGDLTAPPTGSLKYTTSNPAVATVDDSGVVTGMAQIKGTATIGVTYISTGGVATTRYVTVTIDPKAAFFLTADDSKAGAIDLSIVDNSGNPVPDAAMKILQGVKEWPLLKTDSKGSALAYVPAGTYNVIVYSPNGTTYKNYAFTGIKVSAGQRSAPLVQPQFSNNSAAQTINPMNGADKKITGTSTSGATVTAYDGINTLGMAKVDAKGNYSIALKTAMPTKSINITAVDANENVQTSIVEVPLLPSVTLTASTANNDVDHDFIILFKDTVGLLASSVTSVTSDGTELEKGTGYTIATGKLTIKAGAIQALGEHTLLIKSNIYSDSQLTQTIKSGSADASKATYTLSAALAAGQTSTVTAILKDKYGNLTIGKQVFADITVTNTTKKTAERYTISTKAISTTTKNAPVGTVTDSSGITTFTIAIPATIDSGDGISVQLKAGPTAATAVAFGDLITFTNG